MQWNVRQQIVTSVSHTEGNVALFVLAKNVMEPELTGLMSSYLFNSSSSDEKEKVVLEKQ